MLHISTNKHCSEFFERVTSKGFFPRITLPTRIQPPSATLIDNIFTNDIEQNGKSTSGILINDISDHKMIFTFQENNSYYVKVDKYIEIEKSDQLSMNNFIEELKSLNIYDKLNKPLNSSPQDNYEIFSHLLKYARTKHIPLKKVKFDKKKHKKSKWITNAILKSINTKDKLYKILIQTDMENEILYERLKNEFKEFRAILRKSIRAAFLLYKNF